jgi:polysaccharide biosynthesis protein VpsQ
MKILALLFLLFILLVIVAADLGAIPPFIHAMYAFPNGDLVGHFVLYGILAFLLAHAFPKRLNLGRWPVPITALAILAFAALEEISQGWFATRTSSWLDFACSLLGILLGSWLATRRKTCAKA